MHSGEGEPGAVPPEEDLVAGAGEGAAGEVAGGKSAPTPCG